MITLAPVSLTCPMCSNNFNSARAKYSERVIRRHTDLRAIHEKEPLHLFLHSCLQCGFTGLGSDFHHYDISAKLRVEFENFRDNRGTAINLSKLKGSEKHELAAWLAEKTTPPDLRYIAELYLRAAWCCSEETDLEGELFYRKKAARQYEDALIQNMICKSERAETAYLIGELHRRVGDTLRSHFWFQRTIETADPIEDWWIAPLVALQERNPQEIIPEDIIF